MVALLFALALAAPALAAPARPDHAPETIDILPQPLVAAEIDPRQCGQFMEYLCDLFPAMWDERLCDGDFEGLTPYGFDFIRATDDRERPWVPSGQVNRADFGLSAEHPVNGATCYRISAGEGAPCRVGVSQADVYAKAGQSCNFRIWLKGGAEVRVRWSSGSRTLAAAAIRTGKTWHKYQCRLTPTATARHASFSIDFRGPGDLWLDAASLMPEDSVHGWRPDAVDALRALKPGVVRIGGSVMDDPNLGDFQWSDTVGDPSFRKPFRAWGGLQPTGPGLGEFIDLCRTVGAEPLVCVRFRARTPQDAAAEVEYFNGGIDTRMGARRARNGHPAPYRVRLWQVGNERSGPEYERLLPEFCAAMKAVDPTIELLSSFPTDGVLRGSGRYLSYTCPHQYDVANLQAEADELRDVRRMLQADAPGENIKVAVTEWNTTAGDRGLGRAGLWSLANALACSRYQNLLQRNADLVAIADRSNLANSFCSGIIQTDAARLYLTPEGYAQELYANLADKLCLRIEPPAPLGPGLDVSATASPDRREVTIFAVNAGADAIVKRLDLGAVAKGWVGFANVWTLQDAKRSGEPDATNSFDDPRRIAPVRSRAAVRDARLDYAFPPYSLTVVRLWRFEPIGEPAR